MILKDDGVLRNLMCSVINRSDHPRPYSNSSTVLAGKGVTFTSLWGAEHCDGGRAESTGQFGEPQPWERPKTMTNLGPINKQESYFLHTLYNLKQLLSLRRKWPVHVGTVAELSW